MTDEFTPEEIEIQQQDELAIRSLFQSLGPGETLEFEKLSPRLTSTAVCVGCCLRSSQRELRYCKKHDIYCHSNHIDKLNRKLEDIEKLGQIAQHNKFRIPFKHNQSDETPPDMNQTKESPGSSREDKPLEGYAKYWKYWKKYWRLVCAPWMIALGIINLLYGKQMMGFDYGGVVAIVIGLFLITLHFMHIDR